MAEFVVKVTVGRQSRSLVQEKLCCLYFHTELSALSAKTELFVYHAFTNGRCHLLPFVASKSTLSDSV